MMKGWRGGCRGRRGPGGGRGAQGGKIPVSYDTARILRQLIPEGLNSSDINSSPNFPALGLPVGGRGGGGGHSRHLTRQMRSRCERKRRARGMEVGKSEC